MIGELGGERVTHTHLLSGELGVVLGSFWDDGPEQARQALDAIGARLPTDRAERVQTEPAAGGRVRGTVQDTYQCSSRAVAGDLAEAAIDAADALSLEAVTLVIIEDDFIVRFSNAVDWFAERLVSRGDCPLCAMPIDPTDDLEDLYAKQTFAHPRPADPRPPRPAKPRRRARE